MLRAFIDYHRATLAMKCEGLTDEELRQQSMPPSTLSLLGLVRHMAEVERAWFRRAFEDNDAPMVWSDKIDFQAACDSVDSRSPSASTISSLEPSVRTPDPRTLVPDPRAGGDDALADTVLDVIVRRLAGQGPAAHRVWLPPLDNPPSLDALLPGLAGVEGRGLTQPDYAGAGRLIVPIGVVDKPFEQRRDTLYRDFSGAAGHMQIVGGPQSGKSTLLRTIISAFALTHTPHEVQFYGLDFGGGGMSAVAGLPHVGGAASRLDPERVRRTVAEVYGIMTRREEYFRSAGIDSIATFRRMRARGDIPVADQPWGDVFLAIDGWGNFRTEYEGLEAAVLDIAARGLGYGIHLILTASRAMEVRANLKDLLMNRLELRLGDTMDSELDRKAAENVPAGVPGRASLRKHCTSWRRFPASTASTPTTTCPMRPPP